MGSAGTGKTFMLTEALKIKISRLKENGKLKIFVTTFRETYTELQDKYKNHYLANLRQNITFTTIPSLCAAQDRESQIKTSANLEFDATITV